MSAANTPRLVGPVTEHELDAKAVAPRVTEARLNAVIASTHYFTAADGVIGENRVRAMSDGDIQAMVGPLSLLTFCVLVLKNGFTVTGQSACASPENFDREIGKRLALANAKNKMWDLEGYLLKQMLHEQAIAREARGVTEAAARLDRAMKPLLAVLPWVMSAITIWMTVLAGNKHPSAWFVGLCNQALWLFWICLTATWGLLPMNLALWVVYGRNHWRWTR